MDAYALRLDHTVTDQTALCNYSFFRKKTSICNKEKLCKDLYIKDLGGRGERRGAMCFAIFFCRYYKSEN